MFETIWRTQKDTARKLATCNITGASPAKTAIFLPAKDFCCCRQAIEGGTINNQTHMIIVERDPNVMPEVQKGYKKLVKESKLSKNVVFFPKDLHKLNLSDLDRKVDFGFLDWYDELTVSNFGFITHSLSQQLSENADISFTFCLNEWRNRFAKAFQEFLKTPDGKLLLLKTKSVWSYSPDDKTTRILAALRLALHSFEFECFQDPYVYHDTAKVMLCVRLNRIRRSKPCLPIELINRFEEIIDQYSIKNSIWIGKRTKAVRTPRIKKSDINELDKIRIERENIQRRMQEYEAKLKQLEQREMCLVGNGLSS